MNDSREEKPKGERETDGLALFVHTLYASMAFLAAGTAVTLPFMCLPMILSHLRLEEPWPKIIALLGAAVALVLFKLPLSLVMVVFVVGVFVGDSAKRRTDPWLMLVQALGVSLGVAGLYLFIMAQAEGMTVVTYWQKIVADLVTNLAQIEQFQELLAGSLSIDEFRNRVLLQAPFFYAFMIVLVVWTSLGMAAHFKWFPKGHPCNATRLRKLRLSFLVPTAFLLLFLARFSKDNSWFLYADGMFLILSTFVYVEGSVVLSNMMAQRRVNSTLRAIVYSISLSVGFYAMIGLGLVSQWVLRDQSTKKVEAK